MLLLKWCSWCRFFWTDEVVKTLTWKWASGLAHLGENGKRKVHLFLLSVKRLSLFKIYFKCWKKQQTAVCEMPGRWHRCSALAVRQANHRWEGIRLIKYAVFSICSKNTAIMDSLQLLVRACLRTPFTMLEAWKGSWATGMGEESGWAFLHGSVKLWLRSAEMSCWSWAVEVMLLGSIMKFIYF